MKYISTRGNCEPVASAHAIALGMVPAGGLFVPQSVPTIDLSAIVGKSYQENALHVLSPLLTDFTQEELQTCITRAYTGGTFDRDDVIDIKDIGEDRFVMELWHGPTAAFKDVALQIMPHFLAASKKKIGDTNHTLILVATSGDTGKAALEGFKDCEGISIIVFYPDQGVSEIQKLQMATTDGNNTAVVAVKGNFDDCQTAVKQLFASDSLKESLAAQNIRFSSANSINWGRLCPQIVYYFHSYAMLVRQGVITQGEKIDFSVPTGNFGNILAAYYAVQMGLPVERLYCASNKNNILTDFFTTGTYNRNRPFHKTMSPSMDILISSNLERFLFEMCMHDSEHISRWYESLMNEGQFSVDEAVLSKMNRIITPGWVDEQEVLDTISTVFTETGYTIDPHTAVGVAVSRKAGSSGGRKTLIDSTASPFKFSGHVCQAIAGEGGVDEFESVRLLSEKSGMHIHRAIDGLREKDVRHNQVITIDKIEETVRHIAQSLL